MTRAWLTARTAIDFLYGASKANDNGTDHEFLHLAILNAKGATQIDCVKTAELNGGITRRVILTKDPENIKAILTGQFADYGKGEEFHQQWKDFLGDSIFVTDGELWSRSRHLIRPMFVRDRIVDTEIFEKHVQNLIPLLAGSSSPGGSDVVDIGSLFFRFTLDAATDYLLGQGTNSLHNPETRFAEAFGYVKHYQSKIFRLG
jgi:cytochrome P450